MVKELDFFINSLHAEGIDTTKIVNDLNDFFDGDEIPVVFLLGNLGREIYNSKLSFESQKKIFLLIEDAMNSKNKEFSEAVATGLLEAYANAMWNNEQTISSLELMGEQIRGYIKSYLEL